MGQFKPMVKMMTTEPSVELKLKKGGHVSMKKGGKSESGHKKMADGGGAMGALAGTPALIGRPAVNASVRAPGKPSMAARRKAMAPKMPIGNPSMPSTTPMKKGGKAEGGESSAMHKAEMSKMKGLEKELKSHESKPASKGHKGLKTGGVANGQGGYAKGGIINTEGQGGAYRNTKMVTAKVDHSPAKTGGVKDGNGGGYATGGVAKSNGGGYKMGGKAKKAYAAGGTVNSSGSPVAMPQGRKKPSTPVSINQLSGTFKKGGSVTPAEGRLRKNYAAENATAMRQAKAQSNEVYSKYGKMKMADGGKVEDLSKGAYDRHYALEKEENEAMRDAILGAPKRAFESVKGMLSGMGNLTGAERSAFQGAVEKGVQAGQPGVNLQGLREAMQKSGRGQRDIDSLLRGQGAITERERSVTVSPAGKKRGGAMC